MNVTELPVPDPSRRRWMTGCAFCAMGLGWGNAFAREGVDVERGNTSQFAKFVDAGDLEKTAGQQYQQLLQNAAKQNALGPDTHPQVRRLRGIGGDLIPHTHEWNTRARDWRWEINLIGSKQINAFCMPGGKIAFFYGILKELKLDDHEVAMVMGHEMAHALKEHARERMGKTAATDGLARLGGALVSGIFGIDPNITGFLARQGANLLTLKFSREDETEADLVGMELAARAGYNPRAGVSLWQKMSAANKEAPPQWLSTHPSGTSRIEEIERNLNKVLPLYERNRKS